VRRLREATVTEILNANPLARDYGYRVAFRHFVKELSLVTARNGVQHRQYTRSKLRQIDGKLFVRLNGTLQEVTRSTYPVVRSRRWYGTCASSRNTYRRCSRLLDSSRWLC